MSYSHLDRFLHLIPHLFEKHPRSSETRSLASSRSSLPDDGVDEIFIHASSDGVGLVYKIDNHWLAWTIVEDHPAIQKNADGRIDLRWAELMAVELGLLTFLADPFFSSPTFPSGSSASLTQNRILVIRSDNKEVKNAFKRHLWSPQFNPIVMDIREKATANGIQLKVKRVGPRENPAKGPSQGDYPPQELMLGWVPEEEIERAGLGGIFKVVGMASETSSFLSFQSTLPGDRENTRQEIFVDASNTGIGLVYKKDKRWLAWTFMEGHSAIQTSANGRVDACWGELVAVELGLLTFLADPSFSFTTVPSGSSSSLSRKRVLVIKSDNRGVIKAIRRGSWNDRLDSILGRILTRAEQNNVQLQMKWLWTRLNPADKPSRGKFSPIEMMLEWAPPEVEVGMMGLRRVVSIV